MPEFRYPMSGLDVLPPEKRPDVACVLCGATIDPANAYWSAGEGTWYTLSGVPIVLEPLCEGCAIDLATLRDPPRRPS